MYLAIYDLSGIQSYIFATDKLREIIGASIIVNKALFENLPECIGEAKRAWSDECEQNIYFSLPEGKESKIVFIGGGNAVVLFDSEETANKTSLELKKKVFLQSSGKIRVISAGTWFSDGDSFSDTYARLRENLDSTKRRAVPMATAPAFAINVQDNIIYEPIVKVQEKTYAARSRYLKESEADGNTEDYFSYLCPKGCKFTASTDKFRTADEKSYLAVVHIDGNTMGLRISRVMEGCKNSSVFEGLTALRRLSNNINNVYRDTLRQALETVYKGEARAIRFRPIIADGDDITFICAADKAITLVKEFLNILEAKTVSELDDKDDVLSACAGIAFVKTGFPFSVAYLIAEECCKSAKKSALKRMGRSASGFDFHMCYGGATSEISDFRNKNYTFFDIDGNEYRLDMRPYLKCDPNEKYSFDAFERIRLELLPPKDSKEGKRIPRSKLKGIRNAYGKGIYEVRDYIRFLEASDTVLPDCAKNAFIDFDNKKVSTMFDILDIMDIAFGEEDKKNEKTAENQAHL